MGKPWFRWFSGCTNDPKLALVARDSKQPRVVVISVWASVLERANEGTVRGIADKISSEEIAIVLDIDTEAVDAVVFAMEKRGMLAGTKVVAWDKRHPERDRDDNGAAERKRRQREKAKETTSHANLADDTTGHADETNVTPCHTTSHQVTPLDKKENKSKNENKENTSQVGNADLPPPPSDEKPVTTKAAPEWAREIAHQIDAHLEAEIKNRRKPTEANLEQWARDIDLLHRRDGVPVDAIRSVLTWSQSEPFWRDKIQSGCTLREKWNTLSAQHAKRGQPRNGTKPQEPSGFDILLAQEAAKGKATA